MSAQGDDLLKRYWDLIVVVVISLFSATLALVGISGWPLWVFSFGFLLLFPGYLLLGLIFPRAGSLVAKDRLILSMVLSIAVIPLAGFILNYTADLKESTIALAILFVDISLAAALVCVRHRFKEAYSPSFPLAFFGSTLSAFKAKRSFERATIALATVLIVACLLVVIYTVAFPATEPSSELYLLAEDGTIINFPNNVTVGESLNVIVGVANHEGRTVNYTVQVWVVQADIVQGQASVQHMWFQDSMSVELGSIGKGVNDEYQVQWEKELSLSFNSTGEYRVWIFLFQEPTEGDPTPGLDYAGTTSEELIQQALDNEVYNVYLDITVL